MKKLLIAGNWKSNKTVDEAREWVDRFTMPSEALQLVLFVPYTLLPFMASKKLPFFLGAQNMSPFPDGAYTGEISARQIKEFADWVLLGHSERRTHFDETEAMLQKKVIEAGNVGLRVLYCVQNAATPIPKGVSAVAYEPYSAIGTGHPATPEDAEEVCAKIKAKSQARVVLYGGSVTPENVSTFVAKPSIDGVLPGGVSLDPDRFAALIAHAT